MITRTEKTVAAVFVLLVALAAIAFFTVETAYGAKPPSPPGQGECAHGNSLKPCREDPSPNGKDCEEHGPKEGGVNEDHCKGTPPPPPPTTPEETTPEETTPTTEEEPCVVTPTNRACAERPDINKPKAPETPSVDPPASPDSPPSSSPPTEKIFSDGMEKVLEKQAKSNGATSAPSPTSQTPATELPRTGLPLLLTALLGGLLTGTGAWLRRRP